MGKKNAGQLEPVKTKHPELVIRAVVTRACQECGKTGEAAGKPCPACNGTGIAGVEDLGVIARSPRTAIGRAWQNLRAKVARR